MAPMRNFWIGSIILRASSRPDMVAPKKPVMSSIMEMKNRTVERRVGLAFGQFDEHQPTEWRNLRVRSEHRMTEDIFSIGSLKHRRIETVTSKLDLSELRDIGVTKDQAHITMGNDARSFVD